MVPVVRLKVTLLELVPATWRRFQAPASFTLRRLHTVLQGVMGWKESPDHEFRIGDEIYGMPSESPAGLRDSRWIALQDLVARGTRTFSYEYQLASRWKHLVRIEGVSSGDPGNQRPICLAGARACPPDGCGSPDAYVDLLDGRPGTADDPNFDPDTFDLDEINAVLAAMRF
ncbi:MAG TPA: plasmid pRiA4b ORF-3 family protein [Thermoanaerobaculia bacterium]|nr:plasmid pRiA4b ORF-3 family protein [Thermoanaerobaculia bacterium]